jgi:hypothetical protein
MATPKVDIEVVCIAVETFMKARLNTKLAEIDAEKADGMTSPTVPDEAYVFEYWGEEFANFNPVVLIGIAGMDASDGPGPGVVQTVRLQVGVVLTDDGTPNIVRKLLRFQRALTEIFTKEWDTVYRAVKFRVSGIEPFPVSLLHRDQPDRMIGITLEFSLA